MKHMLVNLKSTLNDSKEKFDADFLRYLEIKYKASEISEEQYEAILSSVESWEFQKIVFACVSIETIDNTIMIYPLVVIFGFMLYIFPDSPTNAGLYALVIDKTMKFSYSYPFSHKLWIPNSLSFSAINTIPFWKFVAPVIWLKDDKEAVKSLMDYFKEKIQMKLSSPISQSIMTIIS